MDPSTSIFPLSDSLWFLEILLGVTVLIAVNFVFTKVIKHVRQKSLSTSPGWKQKLDYIFVTPFHVLLWLLGITLVIEVLGTRFGFSFYDAYINSFRSTGAVLCMAWILLRWKKEFQHNYLNKDHHGKKIDAGFVHVLNKISTAVIFVLALLIIFQIWGLNIVPLITFGGISAAAIGFAAKDVIANFFGGLMLYINRPFTEGDLILLPSQNIEGYVEEMGWYLTCIRDKDKRPAYLPNAIFSNIYVVNSSRMSHRRIEQKIQIQHSAFAKIEALTEKIKEAIATHPDTDTHLPIHVVFHAFNPGAIELLIDFYTLQTRLEKYLLVRHEIMQSIYNIFLQEGVEITSAVLQVSVQKQEALDARIF